MATTPSITFQVIVGKLENTQVHHLSSRKRTSIINNIHHDEEIFLTSGLHSYVFNSEHESLPASIKHWTDIIVNGGPSLLVAWSFLILSAPPPPPPLRHTVCLSLDVGVSLSPSGAQGWYSVGRHRPPVELSASCSRGIWPLHTSAP